MLNQSPSASLFYICVSSSLEREQQRQDKYHDNTHN